MVVGKCALCNETKDLIESHIIPSFVGKWLKDTSATRFMRKSTNPNLRVQDIEKRRMLCKDCDQLFSRFETYFAENIFYPFQDNPNQKFPYSEELLKFVISVNWRVLEIQKYSFLKEHSDWTELIEEALKIWKKYLIGLRKNPGPHENHIFFFDQLKKVEGNLEINNLNFYFLRSIDITIGFSDLELFVYSKLPGICIITCICPLEKPEWIGTLIHKCGKIGPPQTMDIGDFLMSRVNYGNRFKISEKQKEKIEQTILSNPSRTLKSKSYEIHLANERLKRRYKMKS